jgi:Cu/Ag efflux pump CusA
LKGVPGVADINGFGGMVKQYQVLVDPQKLSSTTSLCAARTGAQ